MMPFLSLVATVAPSGVHATVVMLPGAFGFKVEAIRYPVPDTDAGWLVAGALAPGPGALAPGSGAPVPGCGEWPEDARWIGDWEVARMATAMRAPATRMDPPSSAAAAARRRRGRPDGGGSGPGGTVAAGAGAVEVMAAAV